MLRVDRTGGKFDPHSPRWQVIFHIADGRDYCRETELAHTPEDEAMGIKIGFTHAEILVWAQARCDHHEYIRSFTLESW